MASVSDLLTLLGARGLSPAAQLQTTLGVSQPTLSRLVRGAGDRVIRLGAARATQYAARRGVRQWGDRWPLYRIDGQGRAQDVGQLSALAAGQYLFEPTPAGAIAGIDTPALFPDLPWFLDDLRPQGFLGRAFAHRVAEGLDLPVDLHRWNAEHHVIAWLAEGDDLPGDLVLGERMATRALRRAPEHPEWVDEAARPQRYAALAEAAMQGQTIGSSAGGEQPKFTASVRDGDGLVRAVIVKFTEAQHSPSKRRWCDLLIAEYHALRALADIGIEAATSELVVAGERLCLEVTRFDRLGAYGRRGVISLLALSMQFDGGLDAWPTLARRLRAAGFLDAGTVNRLAIVWWFGVLIANTDMHLANAACFLDTGRPLTLAPVFDMLPMGYRPASNGEIVPRRFEPALPLPVDLEAWRQAARAAVACWARIAADARVSMAFREIARANGAAVDALRERV